MWQYSFSNSTNNLIEYSVRFLNRVFHEVELILVLYLGFLIFQIPRLASDVLRHIRECAGVVSIAVIVQLRILDVQDRLQSAAFRNRNFARRTMTKSFPNLQKHFLDKSVGLGTRVWNFLKFQGLPEREHLDATAESASPNVCGILQSACALAAAKSAASRS